MFLGLTDVNLYKIALYVRHYWEKISRKTREVRIINFYTKAFADVAVRKSMLQLIKENAGITESRNVIPKPCEGIYKTEQTLERRYEY
jgi:hypothetical protein